MTGPADEPTEDMAGDGAEWAPPPGAWRGGDVWEFAERLAAAIGLSEDDSDEVQVWQWPEDAEPPHASPDYLVVDLSELLEPVTDVTAFLWETGAGWAYTLEPFHGATTVATLKTAYPWQSLDLGNLTDPGEEAVFAAAAAACRTHPRGPRIQVQAGPAEPFESMVEHLIAAGAHGLGGRLFQIRPPLSPRQLAALQALARLDPGIHVTADPPDADLWHADPTAPEPPTGFDTHAWWQWQTSGGNPDDQPPR